MPIIDLPKYMKSKIDLEATLAAQNAWGMSQGQLYHLIQAVAEGCVEYYIEQESLVPGLCAARKGKMKMASEIDDGLNGEIERLVYEKPALALWTEHDEKIYQWLIELRNLRERKAE